MADHLPMFADEIEQPVRRHSPAPQRQPRLTELRPGCLATVVLQDRRQVAGALLARLIVVTVDLPPRRRRLSTIFRRRRAFSVSVTSGTITPSLPR
jgi:hypothetical protein